jgi:hypothetical protein
MAPSFSFRDEVAALERQELSPAQRRAAWERFFGRLAAAEQRGELRVSEWQQRCLVSAMIYFRQGNLEAALTQVRAFGKDRSPLIPFLQSFPSTLLRDLLREVDEEHPEA